MRFLATIFIIAAILCTLSANALADTAADAARPMRPQRVVTQVEVDERHAYTREKHIEFTWRVEVLRSEADRVRVTVYDATRGQPGGESEPRMDATFVGDNYVLFVAHQVQSASTPANVSQIRSAFVTDPRHGLFMEGAVLAEGEQSIWQLLAAKDGENARVRRQSEGDTEFTIIERNTAAGELAVWLLPDRALARFTLVQNKRGKVYKSFSASFRATEFRIVDGVRVPWVGEFKLDCAPLDGPGMRAQYVAKRLELQYGTGLPDDAFVIKSIPNGTPVTLMDKLDKPIPHVWRDGKPVADIDYELLRMLEQEAGRGPTTQKKAK